MYGGVLVSFSWWVKSRGHMSIYGVISRYRNHILTYETIFRIISSYVNIWSHIVQYEPYIDIWTKCWHIKQFCAYCAVQATYWRMKWYWAIWIICWHVLRNINHMLTYETIMLTVTQHGNICNHIAHYQVTCWHMKEKSTFWYVDIRSYVTHCKPISQHTDL